MIKRIATAAAALLFTSSIVAPAQAAVITYTLTGSFSGVNGGPFNDVSAVFTGVANTEDAYLFAPSVTVVPLSAFFAVADGLTHTFDTHLDYFINRDQGLSGFGAIPNSFIRFNGAFGSYDGVSALDATALTIAFGGANSPFHTDRGDVVIQSASNLMLSASVDGAVPEPASWALMVGGFGMIGCAMRSRRKAVVGFG